MYNVSMYVYLSFSVPRTSSARSMLRGAQSSVQEACCLDIGFRHMSSAPDCVAFSCCMRRVAEEREPLYSFESAWAVIRGRGRLWVGLLPNHLGRDSGSQFGEIRGNV